MSYVGSILVGFRSLLTGMRITLRQSARKSVTLTYPHKKPEISDAYRGTVDLVRFDETGTHDCIACLQCVKICPSYCITIEGGRVEGMKKARADRVEMDFALCSLCGLCIDTCPTETLKYSKIYDDVGYQRNWKYDLLAPFRDGEEAFREQQREIERREAEAKAAAKAAAAAKKAAESPDKPEGDP
ncbi:MAG: 4Fe-4S dicluster domain-containing protein [Phycisphaeraceae bacterium]|nr:4Fe-4S dicluster domain-containing protein [Phycisphaeraceae bacterium]